MSFAFGFYFFALWDEVYNRHTAVKTRNHSHTDLQRSGIFLEEFSKLEI